MTQVDLWTLENELRTPDAEPLCGVDEASRIFRRSRFLLSARHWDRCFIP